MPAVSKKQERFMQAVANNPKFAKKAGVPQSVGREFTKSEGGQMKNAMKKVAKAEVKGHEARMHGAKKMAKGGLAAGHKAADGVAQKGKTKGMQVKMAMGGMAKKSSCK